ncbi:hypothetical protein ACHQM5_018939 [Ranunculus cassubicifolius]
MFSFLAKNLLLHKRNLVYSPQFHPCLIQFISTDSIPKNNSFTISYLINTCGFSQEKAISVSKYVNFESSTNPDSVLTLFRNYGFSDSQISTITAKFPRLLLSKVDKTLKPKFDFFNSKGLCGDDLAKVLCRDASVLTDSLEKNVIPSFEFLRNVLGTDEKVIAMLKRSMDVLRINHEKVLSPKIVLLKAHGVPDSNIRKLLVSQPWVFRRNVDRFNEMVEEVKKMKFEPSRYTFCMALHMLHAMSRSSLEAKFDVYRSWGWSEDELQYAFRMNPHCVLLSEKNIMSTMECFVNEFGYSPSSIAKQPSVLLYSCEGRIIPRSSVIQVLVANGHIEKAPTLGSFLALVEAAFFKKYISKFEKEVPELLSIYQGKGKMNTI